MSKTPSLIVLTATTLAAISVLLAGCGPKDSPSELPKDSEPSKSSPSGTSVPAGITSTAPLQPTTTIPAIAPTAADIALNSIAAAQKFQSLKFDMDYAMSFTLPTSTTPGTMTMQQTAVSSVNVAERKMAMVFDGVMEIPNQGKQNVSGAMYSIDGWFYMKASVPGVADQWTKMRLTDELWAAQSRLSSLTGFLKDAVALDLAGSERVGGIDCYVLSIAPGMNSLSNWIAGQTQSGQSGVDLNGTDIGKVLQGVTVKEWIAKDSLLPVRQQIGIKLDMSSMTTDQTGASSQMKMDMSATLNFHDYGQAVSIQLPPEALNAKDVTPQ